VSKKATGGGCGCRHQDNFKWRYEMARNIEQRINARFQRYASFRFVTTDFFSSWLDSPCGSRPPLCLVFEITLRHTTLSRTPLEGSLTPFPDYAQHSQETGFHVPGGTRTRSPSKRAAADPHLRPHGHWHQPLLTYRIVNHSLHQK